MKAKTVKVPITCEFDKAGAKAMSAHAMRVGQAWIELGFALQRMADDMETKGDE
jgi:hypothetical protein